MMHASLHRIPFNTAQESHNTVQKARCCLQAQQVFIKFIFHIFRKKNEKIKEKERLDLFYRI